MTPKILLLLILWIILTLRFHVNGEKESGEKYRAPPQVFQRGNEKESGEKLMVPPPPPPPPPQAKVLIPLVPPTEIPIATTPSSSTSSGTCPCVKKPGMDTCVVYDAKIQAATVEEAIINFPDLTTRKLGADNSDPTLQKHIISNSISSGNIGTDGSKIYASTSLPFPAQPITPNPNELCQTDECKTCSNMLMPQLVANGLLNSTDIDLIKKRLGVSNNITDCSKYNVRLGQRTSARTSTKVRSRRPTSSNSSSTLPSNSVSSPNVVYIDDLTKNGLSYWNVTHAVIDTGEVPQRPEMRLKRQTLTINATIGGGNKSGSASAKIVGERFKIGCIKRGEPLEKNSEWVSLCDACWVWRKLPTEYFPQYINELICDSDQKCLSGWGTCQQQFRNVDILKNLNTNGKDDWQAVTLESSNYCECAVKTGSALHSFVTA